MSKPNYTLMAKEKELLNLKKKIQDRYEELTKLSKNSQIPTGKRNSKKFTDLFYEIAELLKERDKLEEIIVITENAINEERSVVPQF